MSNIPDRTLLKNLGHWLGIITIGRNKPILATVRNSISSISLKTLLSSGFGNQIYRHRSIPHGSTGITLHRSIRFQNFRIMCKEQSKTKETKN